MHYYNFNIGDYIKHTMHLTVEEDITYRRLLDLYYDTESPIPTDIHWVSRRLRMGSEVVESVLKEFFDLTDEGYRNYRADAEIADYHAYIDKQRSNGKLGGRPKKSSGKPTANPSQTQVEPKKSLNNKQQPTNNNQQPIVKTLAAPDGVSPATWSDFLQVRKAKKAPVTAAAIAGIEREARKAHWSLEKALVECCARGWAGFKAEWVNKEQQQNKTQHQINQEGIARSLGLLPKHDEYQGNVIEGEIYDAEPTTKRLG
jgi:uncharacterized protein YdaU (DUF1376 family)